MKEILNKNKEIIFALFISLLATNLFAFWYVSQEHCIYTFDSVNYWEKLDHISNDFIKNPLDTLKHIIYSVREDDYNDFPALLLMPFRFLFGISRLSYLLAVINVFALPVILSFILLHKKLSDLEGISLKTLPFITISAILLFPNFWQPILSGYLDIGGVFIINWVLLLYLKRPYQEQKLRDLLLMAVLISIIILFRRWYAYWGVAFYAAVLFKECTGLFIDKIFSFKGFRVILLRIFAQMAVSGAFLFAVAPTFAYRILTTDYSDTYSAFRTDHTIPQSFINLVLRFGLFYFSLFILGIVQGIRNKKIRPFSILLIVQWLLIFFLFVKTQDFGRHQLYLLMPTMLIFIFLSLTRMISHAKASRAFLIAGLLFISILNFIPGFSSENYWYTRTFPGIFTNFHQAPSVRPDINEIERLLQTLEELAPQKVYVLASSFILNCQTLNRAYLSLGRHREIAQKIAWSDDIDKRDGFPEDLLNATYVVVAYPIQYDINAKYERVTGIPAEMFLENKGVAKSFTKLNYEFNLEKNVKVYIYKRIKPLNESDLVSLSQNLEFYYPDRKDIYEIKRELVNVKKN